MREIEFRGKLTNNRGWTFGNLNIHTDGCVIMTPDSTPLGRYGKVEPETVGQYTGLKDKNGNKIFEGDIVKITEDGCMNGFMGIVEYNINAFELKNTNDYEVYEGLQFYEEEQLEVIGNIYDNPELLEIEW